MDHMNYYYAPIRPGDSFRVVVDHHEFKDITPVQGSNTRTLRRRSVIPTPFPPTLTAPAIC